MKRTYSRLALSLLLASGPLAALPATAQPARHGAPAARAAVLDAVLRGDFLVRLWDRVGCTIDPFGETCRPGVVAAPASPGSPVSVRAESGCGLDPFGGCAQSLTTAQPLGGH